MNIDFTNMSNIQKMSDQEGDQSQQIIIKELSGNQDNIGANQIGDSKNGNFGQTNKSQSKSNVTGEQKN